MNNEQHKNCTCNTNAIGKKDYWQLWRDTIVTQFQSLLTITGFSVAALTIFGLREEPLEGTENVIFKLVAIALAIQVIFLLWEAHNDRKAAWYFFAEGKESPSRVFYSVVNNYIYIWPRVAVIVSWLGILFLVWKNLI